MRIPKAWAPTSGRVVLRREADRIIITEEGRDLRELAKCFAADGLIDFERRSQPETPPVKSW